MLLIKNFKQKKLNKKLFDKLLNSFKILKFIKKQTYKQFLSTNYRIYNVFYVFFLKLYKQKRNNVFILKYFSLKFINNEKE